ncbi:MAG TPA: hypothetical protein VFF85_09715, partial [Microbacterium sp.]|nr:hypothetical protein [Microbacterium sp.]
MQTLPHADGVVIGGFTDHHVHLQLVDHTLLAGSRLGRVVDLGGNPRFVSSLRSSLNDQEHAGAARLVSSLRSSLNDQEASERRTERVEVTKCDAIRRTSIEFAGAFLTPVGGYPSDRAWAPAGSFREIASEADAAAAVTEMADAGASRIKVASNSTAGSVFDDD